MNAISYKIDLEGKYIDKFNAYFFVIILNFIFIPFIQINIPRKILWLEKNFVLEDRFLIFHTFLRTYLIQLDNNADK